MRRKVRARIKGYFYGIAVVTLDSDGNIEEVEDIVDIDEVNDCEVIKEIFQIK